MKKIIPFFLTFLLFTGFINVNAQCTTANAGPDQNNCNNGSGEYVFTMNANDDYLTSEVGTWSIKSGAATIADIYDPFTQVTVIAGETAVLEWRISSEECPDSVDEIELTTWSLPTVTLKSDSVCVGIPLTITAVATPTSGTFEYNWLGSSIIASVPYPSSTSPNYVVDTDLPQNGRVEVTVKDEHGCVSNRAVAYVRVHSITTANAGPNQDECDNGNGEYVFTMNANDNYNTRIEVVTWSIKSGAATIADIHDPFTQVTVLAGETAVLEWRISDGKCPDSVDEIELTTWNIPTVTLKSDSVCVGTPLTITAVATPTSGTFEYNWLGSSIIASVPYPSSTSPNYVVDTDLPQNGRVEVTVKDEHGCVSNRAVAYVAVRDLPNITIDPLPEVICKQSTVNLNAIVTPTYIWQQYTWHIYYSSNNGVSWSAPVQILSGVLSGTYQVDVADNVTHVKFAFDVKMNSNCSHRVETPQVAISAAIYVDISGPTEATVCEGGSTVAHFELSGNFAPPVYYRWLENGIAIGDICQGYLLPYGVNHLELTSNPALHENEVGVPYCYQLEIWRGGPDPLVPGNCPTLSDCFYLTVVKDPTATISGPYSVEKQLDTPPVFTANVIGGVVGAYPTYQWYLNGAEVLGVKGNEYTMNDPEVLGSKGIHFVAVRVLQDAPGCMSNLTYHYFTVGKSKCPTHLNDAASNIVYNVVEIGGICWTKENLRGTTYQNGGAIPFARSYESAQYPNATQNEANFGLLYDWNSVADPSQSPQGICPIGWRLPTLEEWQLLLSFNADALKNTAYWLSPNNYSNDPLFDIRAAGSFNSNANRFENLYGSTAFWSSNASNNTCTAAVFNYYCSYIEFVEMNKANGLSVRCVME